VSVRRRGRCFDAGGAKLIGNGFCAGELDAQERRGLPDAPRGYALRLDSDRARDDVRVALAQEGDVVHAVQQRSDGCAADVVAALLGLDLREVRIDRPDVGVPGRAVVRTSETTFYEHLLATLAGPIAANRWEVLEWPLDETTEGDLGIVARLCKHLHLDRVDLFVAEQRVRRLLEDRSVRGVLTAVGWELLEHGAIPGHRVYEILREENVDEAVVKQAAMPPI
jgi:hypothetical protein